MKIGEITATNFCNYERVTVSFDDNVTYLVGRNGSGKSTIGITAIWAAFQGIAEKATDGKTPLVGERFRFIGRNGATAKLEMTLYDEAKGIEVKVTRKISKTGTEVSFVGPGGMVLDQKWLTDLFNIFLIAPKKFQELNSKDQAKAIGIDTTTYDTAIADLKKEYTGLNAISKSFGDITTVAKAEIIDVAALIAGKTAMQNERAIQRKVIADALNAKYLENKAANDNARNQWQDDKNNVYNNLQVYNDDRASKIRIYNSCSSAYATLSENGFTGSEIVQWMERLHASIPPLKEAEYPAEPTYVQELPDNAEILAFDENTAAVMAELDQSIQDANTSNQNALLYNQYLQKVEQKKAADANLADNVQKQSDQQAARLAYIKQFKLPFGNMSIGEDGDLLFNGKPIKEPYFSTGELLKIIPILISTGNPEMKYVFLQDFNLLDEDKQKDVIEHLTAKGFQLVIEYIGKAAMVDKNCILLKDNVVVESYEEQPAELLTV